MPASQEEKKALHTLTQTLGWKLLEAHFRAKEASLVSKMLAPGTEDRDRAVYAAEVRVIREIMDRPGKIVNQGE